MLWGTSGTSPSLPLPAVVIATLTGGGLLEVTPGVPTYDAVTHKVTIPGTANVLYYIDDVLQTAGDITLVQGEPVLVVARPATGYKFPAVSDDDWLFEWPM